MADLADITLDHYQQQAALARKVAAETDRLWLGVDPKDISRSWVVSSIDAFVVVTAGQVLAASAADRYTTAALEAQDIDPDAAGRINARQFGGVASDGRPLDTLLYEPAVAAKSAIGRELSVEQAMVGARALLDMIVRTQVADAGRTAVGSSIVARRQATGYIRMLNPPSCSRCVVLAGRRYGWSAGFPRHPRCDCRHIPTAEDRADDVRTDPKAYFTSLTRAEQDQVFTNAGAEAIRDGADINRVVNARKGLFEAGGRTFTTEATTTRGRLPGQAKGPRLTTEQIYAQAGDDRAEAIRLLKLHGYLI